MIERDVSKRHLTFAVPVNLKRNHTLGTQCGIFFHIRDRHLSKVRSRTRDLNETVRSYNQNANWSLTGYTGQADIPSLISRYRATGTGDGRNNYGYFLDPAVVRNVSDTLLARGLVTPLSTNAFNSRYDDYSASEDITSGYLMGQTSRGRLTVLGGLRAEQTKTRFETFNVIDGVPVAITPGRDYTDWMPGLHLRFDLNKNLVVRGAYTETIARPTFNQLNPARLRLSLHHRSEVLFDLATDNVLALARYEAPSTTLDFTASYRVWRNWPVHTEFSNLTNEPSHGYNGNESLRLDYNEVTGWSAVLGLRWNL